MYKLGEFCEEDAKPVADYLRKAGMKVEVKPSIDASVERDEFLQGKLSELNEDIKDRGTIETYERYLAALKNILLSKPSPESLENLYLNELFPTIDESRKRLKSMLQPAENGMGEVGQSDGSLTDEAKGLISEMASLFAKVEKAKDFAVSAISLNEIIPGEDIGNRLDDPIVAIPVDLDDYGTDHPRAKMVISTFLNKCYDIYIDEFSLFLVDNLDDEFIKLYSREHLKIASFNFLLTDLIENRPSDKTDFETFKEECWFEADSKNRTLRVFGSQAAEEIAKSLEKNGMIKIKGDVIKWKK